MKKYILFFLWVVIFIGQGISSAPNRIKLVTTLSVYADIAQYIGGDRVEVRYIVQGDQDAHVVKPKPSYAVWLSEADLFIDTGLDLELWVPPLVDKAGNPRIRSGQDGYVAAADGIRMLEVPSSADRSQGDVHIYGNPHVYTSPLNAKRIAENITIGLSKVSPSNVAFFQERLKQFQQEIDERLFGRILVQILGGKILTRLTESHKLFDFLERKSFKGKPLIDYLEGWMQEMMPLRGQKLVAYHKNWAYFEDLFELDIIGYVEPKPNIPPSPRHVKDLINKMREYNIRVILAANYFDERKVREIARKVNAKPVIVPLSVRGVAEVEDYFQLIDYWVIHLRTAFGYPTS